MTCRGTSSNAVVVTSGKIIGQTARGTVSSDGRVYGTSSGNGITVITTGRLSGRSGGGTFRQSDGCTGTWTAANNSLESHPIDWKQLIMPCTVRHTVRITLFSFLVSAALPTTATLAQSGSAGGSIGNEEKSLSGSRQAPRTVEPSKPARRAKPEAEEPRRASRRSGGGGGGGGGGAWQFRWRLGCRFLRHTLRQQHRKICHLRRPDFG